jgi:predicted phosphodiesterase
MAYWSRAEKLIANLMLNRSVEEVQTALLSYGCTKHGLDDISDFVADINAGSPEAAMPTELRDIILPDQDIEGTGLHIEISGPPTEPMVDFERVIANRMAGLDFNRIPMNQKRFLAQLIAETHLRVSQFPRPIMVPDDPKKEAAVLILSDHHFGKRVLDDKQNILYDRDIARFRVGQLLPARTIKLLTRYLNPDEIDEIHILMVGDIVDGHGVYVGQELNQDVHSFVDQVSDATSCIWNLISQLRNTGHNWPVYVRGVRGNHGRQHKYAMVENNFDYLVLQNLKMLAHYEDPKGVDVDYSSEEYYNHTIKGWNVLMRHEAPEQPETPARKAKFAGWQDIHDFDIMCYGHKHHPANTVYTDKPLFMNGSPVGMDDLAERMATFAKPSQTLFGISTKHGQTFHYNVYLDEVEDNGDKAREDNEGSS